jgi:hypothetical protein
MSIDDSIQKYSCHQCSKSKDETIFIPFDSEKEAEEYYNTVTMRRLRKRYCI